MALFNASVLIKESRLARGLTQEQLAEGICSRETVNKLENGQRKPSWFVIRQVMRRLDLDPELHHYDVVSDDEFYLVDQTNKMTENLFRYNHQATKTEIDKIEKLIADNDPAATPWKSGLGYELLLGVKAELYADGPLKDPERAAVYALERIKIRRPDFEISRIPGYTLAAHERKSVNTLAIAYSRAEKHGEALEVWGNLIANMERNYAVNALNTFDQRWYSALLLNMTRCLGKAGRYEERIVWADRGMDYSAMHHDMDGYFRYMNMKWYALLQLGRIEEGEELGKKVFAANYAFDGFLDVSLAAFKEAYEEDNGKGQDLIIAW